MKKQLKQLTVNSIHAIEYFEKIIAWILILIVSTIVVVSVYRVTMTVFIALFSENIDPLSFSFFQQSFGQIMTVLIALEFNRSIIQIVRRLDNLFQIKIVLLIAMLALSRKFIILDLSKTTPMQMFGMAAIMLVLGIVYWLVTRFPLANFEKEG